MLRMLFRARTLALAALTAVLLSPVAAMAYEIVCWRDYDRLVCNDGTRIGCLGRDSFGIPYQRDCTHEDAHHCAGHQGLREIDPGKGGSQEAEFIAEYVGNLQLDEHTGDGEINSTVVATLEVLCNNGRVFTCDDKTMACPSSYREIVARCDRQGGLRSADVFTAFTRLR